MSNEIKPEGQAAPQPDQAAAASQTGGTPEQPAQPQSASPHQLDDQPQGDIAAQIVLDKLMTENADLKDKLLRVHAEIDNIRKRTEREKADAHRYAVTKFAHDIVTVGDNFQRAIDSVPAAAAEQSAALKSFLEGVSMTERELLNTLERHGIKRIDPSGQMFNPHHHQAVSEVQNPEVPSGTITQVFQCGYLIEDRVLRPAMVVVAKGGAKVAKAVEYGGEAVQGHGAPSQELPRASNDDAPTSQS